MLKSRRAVETVIGAMCLFVPSNCEEDRDEISNSTREAEPCGH